MSDEVIGDPSEGRTERTLFEGLAFGGPLDGQLLTSRFPAGIVAVSKQSNKVWIYDFGLGATEGDHFRVRDEAGVEADTEKRSAAAEGTEYDVVAVA